MEEFNSAGSRGACSNATTSWKNVGVPAMYVCKWDPVPQQEL